MKGLTKRVEDLEQQSGGGVTRWHWLIGEPGEELAEARARHHELVPENDGIIFWRPV